MCARVARAAAFGLIFAVLTAAAPAFAQVDPQVLSPLAATDYVFGLQIAVLAHDQNGLCAALPEDYEWFFREQGDPWPASGYFFDDPDRLLTDRIIPLGCDLAPAPADPCVADGKKRYQVKVRMCGVDSPTVPFQIVYAPLPADPPHPSFPPDDGEPFPDPPNDGDFCFVDWGAVDTNGVQDHAATEHFNVFWPATFSLCDPSIALALPPLQPVLPPPTAARLGLMECIYTVLDADMVSPLSGVSIYRNAPAYAGITKLPLITGHAVTGGGGGQGEIQGLAHGPLANAPTTDWVAIHELFHVFDYAGNPLHYRNRDYRYEANPYHFYHESTAVLEQAMSSSARVPWGYRWDSWPAWIPLDLGLTELDYDAAPFWAYVLGRYGFTPRRSLHGPAIDACEASAQDDLLGNELMPHRYKFFEQWNAITRAAAGAVEPVLRSYVPNHCPVESQYGPVFSGTEADSPLNNGALYTGLVDPACLQTLEYDLSVVQDLARANAGAWGGTELAESIQLDFAIDFAKRFPPKSLLSGIPDSVVCAPLASLQRSSGFDSTPFKCLTGESDDASFPGIRPDAPICAGVNPHDFWARIEFRITTASPRWIRVLANDDATVFVDGTAVIDGPDPFGRANYQGFPPASTTYADQRYQFPENHAPRTSLFRVGDARSHRYEIEWVNRGDGRGNGDYDCDTDRSRYLLQVEGYDTTPAALAPVPDGSIEIVRAEFWGGQGSGYPPGGPGAVTIPPDYKNMGTPLEREVQLRPVGGGARPFLLPPLAAHYHPVACPTGYAGAFEVSVRDDLLTETRPSVHLLALKAPDTVEWRGVVPARDADERSVVLACDGVSEVANHGGDPAFLVVSTARTLHGPADLFGTLGAVHYTVLAGNPGVDADDDGVADYRDNCPYEANPSQADGGRLGSFLPDWIGTSCQCGDVTNDGAVLPDDVTVVRNWLARVTTSLPAGQKCNVIGPAGTSPTQDCDVRDMAVLLRSMTPDQLAPGPSPVCRPALP